MNFRNPDGGIKKLFTTRFTVGEKKYLQSDKKEHRICWTETGFQICLFTIGEIRRRQAELIKIDIVLIKKLNELSGGKKQDGSTLARFFSQKQTGEDEALCWNLESLHRKYAKRSHLKNKIEVPLHCIKLHNHETKHM